MKKVRWGLIGCSSIARRYFLGGAALVPEADICGVASRDIGRTNEFADEFGIDKRYSCYDDLLDDPDIDVVYISLINNLHYDIMKKALAKRKNVLCEKPLVINSVQAKEVISLARKNNIFLMEGMWTRCLPIYQDVRRWLDDDRIGQIRMVQINDGNFVDFDQIPQAIRGISPEMGGGTLLDNGIYTLALANWIFQKRPEIAASYAVQRENGIDMEDVIVLNYDEKRIATLTTSLMTKLSHTAVISGQKGKIEIDDFWRANSARLYSEETDFHLHKHIFTLEEEKKYDYTNGFEFEISHVCDCIARGLTESPLRTLDDTLLDIELMDALRKRWGVVFTGNYGEE